MLVAYDSALERILAAAEPLVPVDTPLERCSGRVLAHGLHAPLDLPPFDNSAMDGYAVRAANTASAAPERPAFLQIIGEIAAGSAPGDVHLESGQAARIFTGGIVPPGADAIIPVEDTEPEGAPPGQVAVTLPAEPNAYIRHAGGDMRKGDLALLAGTALRAYEIAQAASLGAASLPVHPAPRVVLIATGNELVEPGLAEPLQTGQIYNSNVYALEALVRESGGETLARLHAVDTPDSIRDTLRQAARLQPDIIISSGGVSVGDYDFVKAAVEEDNGRGAIDFWRVAIRPGKPFVFGRYGGALFFGLPGNPVSTIVTYELFVRPALRRLAGYAREQCAAAHPAALRARRSRPATSRAGAASSGRSSDCIDGGGQLGRRAPVSKQGSHMIGGLVQANSLLVDARAHRRRAARGRPGAGDAAGRNRAFRIKKPCRLTSDERRRGMCYNIGHFRAESVSNRGF